MGHEGDGLGSMVDRVLDGWKSTDNTLVVGNFLLRIKGDVEVYLCCGVKSILPVQSRQVSVVLTLMRTRLSLSSTSVMASLLERDILYSCYWASIDPGCD